MKSGAARALEPIPQDSVTFRTTPDNFFRLKMFLVDLLMKAELKLTCLSSKIIKNELLILVCLFQCKKGKTKSADGENNWKRGWKLSKLVLGPEKTLGKGWHPLAEDKRRRRTFFLFYNVFLEQFYILSYASFFIFFVSKPKNLITKEIFLFF